MCIVLILGAISCWPAIAGQQQLNRSLGAFAYVTVGVADMDVALNLWVEQFGMEIRRHRSGDDGDLSQLWGLSPDAVDRQVLLGTPGIDGAELQLVEFKNPDPPVRLNAEVLSRVPKNLDIYVCDLPAKAQTLQAAGFRFRSDWKQVSLADGRVFREIQMFGHDDTNIVLVELLGEDWACNASGYAAMGPVVTIVADAAAESQFYQDLLGLDLVLRDRLAGPDIEKMIGLPAGAGLDVRVLGDLDNPMGRIEAIEYEQLDGPDLYSRARPPALGTLHVGYQVQALDWVRRQLDDAGIAYQEFPALDLIGGNGRVLVVRTPAGFRIEIQQVSANSPQP